MRRFLTPATMLGAFGYVCGFFVFLSLFGAIGCFRATGFEVEPPVAFEIPAVGGDRVTGMKSSAGAGDYYIGNDFIALSIDGTPLAGSSPIGGVHGGGSIVDVGYIELDRSYRRVSMPCDMLDRMSTVVNQDPDISLAFDEIIPSFDSEFALIEMNGLVYDPLHKLSGAEWDNDGFVKGLVARTSIRLSRLDRRFAVETTITNNHSSAIGVRSIGDFVFQRGGGFRFLAAANEDSSGAPMSAWGVDIPVNAPGTDFSNPLSSSVRCGPVVFMGTEPSANTLDCHSSLGLLPMDSHQFLVISDPQDGLNESRPIFPERIVVGGLDTGAQLEPNESLRHLRHLYVRGGTSGAQELVTIVNTMGTPNQATGLLNEMLAEYMFLEQKSLPLLRVSLSGTGIRSSPIQSELRFERYIGEDDAMTDEEPNHWRLERLEWMEPPDMTENTLSGDGFTNIAESPLRNFGVYLPEGTYRVVSRNKLYSSTIVKGKNAFRTEGPDLEVPIELKENEPFWLNEFLAPERSILLSPWGSLVYSAQAPFYIFTICNDAAAVFIQPMRFAIVGQDVPDPTTRRFRSITSSFDTITRQTRLPGPPRLPIYMHPGQFHFVGGNSAFGIQMINGFDVTAMYLSAWTSPGNYIIYGARGPLSNLETARLNSRPGVQGPITEVTVFQARPPEGWVGFDTPGPSQATSGGMLPCEQLASALAEDVRVVAVAELDRQTDANALYNEFQLNLTYTYELKTAIGGSPDDPIIGDPLIISSRSSDLDLYGTVTAHFTPANSNARNGGARPSGKWTLADFLAQSEGKFCVIHRPRGPNGVFTRKGFNSTLPLDQAAPWWHETGLLSLGKRNGDFDAIEILNGGSLADSGIDVWWSEFKSVRADWFSLLSQQRPDSFTKAVGFSSGKYSQDTPVGLVRTWLNVGDAVLLQSDPSPILNALKSGAAVVPSGPMLDVNIEEAGPGGLATIGDSPSTVTLNVTLVAPEWVPVDEIRVVVNGQVVATRLDPKSAFTRSETDSRFYSGTITVPVPAGKDAWVVVEAGAPLGTSGVYKPDWKGWNALMKGIYPVAITNPIFLDLNGSGYEAPGL